jgi:hypothetical protein
LLLELATPGKVVARIDLSERILAAAKADR